MLCDDVACAEDSEMTTSIAGHRMGSLVVKATPGAKVTVTQLDHEFWFGTAISQQIFTGRVTEKDREQYLAILKANFNSAVHENALKWYSTEKRKGRGSLPQARL
jgi:GH35 family endo-1,4-beta-xylanase